MTVSTPRSIALAALLATLAGACTAKSDPIAQAEKGAANPPDIAQTRAIAQDACTGGFPRIAAYKAMYRFNVDTSSSQYKGPFNQVISDARVFTPRDTAIVTPNSDTPYSLLQMDLRAEPLVLCVPAIDPRRYYSVQLVDLYTFHYGYIGSRATGSRAGCYLVAGPGWQGKPPPGIARTFRSATEFSLALYRTECSTPPTSTT